jgi:plastocyanin
MRIPQYIFIAAAIAAVTASLPAQSSQNESGSTFSISGEANLIAVGPTGSTKDASKIVVWLSPINSVRPVRATVDSPHYRCLQHNKRFEPGLLVIPVGSVVDFPNLDPWFHNVFSLYRGKRFDLGLYQAGAQRSVHFDRVGPSYLFCNIHPEMTGVVLALDSELFGVTDKNGRYTITGVAPGRYILRVWYENARPEALQALQRQVTIERDNQALQMIAVPAAKRTPAQHKNKYGQDYDPQGLKTEY